MTQPKQTIDEGDERAVSPVIGVILMVAITVILAAVIGTFVLDLGQNVQNTGPSASFGFEDAEETFDAPGSTSEDFVVIEHQSGESIDGDDLKITIRNATSNAIVTTWDANSVDTGTGVDLAGTTWELNSGTFDESSTVGVGDVITVSIQSDGSATAPGPGYEYDITVVSKQTDNRIGTGTVEVN